MKGFREVNQFEFRDFIEKHENDVKIRDLYDINPPLIAYITRNENPRRLAYIENNQGAFNGRPNKYFIINKV